MLQDTLADVLSTVKNAERIGKKECIVRASKMTKSILKIFQENDFIGPFEFIDDGRSGKFKIELKGKIIDCNVIKPRFSVAIDEIEKWEKRYLPAKGIGLLIMTTPRGIMTHNKAKEMHTGGKLVCYVY